MPAVGVQSQQIMLVACGCVRHHNEGTLPSGAQNATSSCEAADQLASG